MPVTHTDANRADSLARVNGGCIPKRQLTTDGSLVRNTSFTISSPNQPPAYVSIAIRSSVGFVSPRLRCWIAANFSAKCADGRLEATVGARLLIRDQVDVLQYQLLRQNIYDVVLHGSLSRHSVYAKLCLNPIEPCIHVAYPRSWQVDLSSWKRLAFVFNWYHIFGMRINLGKQTNLYNEPKGVRSRRRLSRKYIT